MSDNPFLMTAHRVYIAVAWNLELAELGTTKYFELDEEALRRVLIERLTDGQPITVQFKGDEHYFNEPPSTDAFPHEPSDADVLRMVADRLDDLDEMNDC